MATETRPKIKPGETAPDFTLPSVDGRTLRLADELKRKPATVVLFICNHCPYVKAYIPRLIEIQRETAGNCGFIGICSNDAIAYPDDNFDNMKKASAGWKLNFPYAHDADQRVARAFGAERTPEIFVLNSNGVCRYEGGIDDNYQDPAKVTRRPLRDAILAVAAGKAVAEPWTHAIGCTIKWKKA